MNKDDPPADDSDELRPEYQDKDLRNGVRGKYAQRYAAGTNLVRLESDVAAAFPNERAVNDALRVLLRAAQSLSRDGGR
jgi:hypothetical protein